MQLFCSEVLEACGGDIEPSPGAKRLHRDPQRLRQSVQVCAAIHGEDPDELRTLRRRERRRLPANPWCKHAECLADADEVYASARHCPAAAGKRLPLLKWQVRRHCRQHDLRRRPLRKRYRPEALAAQWPDFEAMQPPGAVASAGAPSQIRHFAQLRQYSGLRLLRNQKTVAAHAGAAFAPSPKLRQQPAVPLRGHRCLGVGAQGPERRGCAFAAGRGASPPEFQRQLRRQRPRDMIQVQHVDDFDPAAGINRGMDPLGPGAAPGRIRLRGGHAPRHLRLMPQISPLIFDQLPLGVDGAVAPAPPFRTPQWLICRFFQWHCA